MSHLSVQKKLDSFFKRALLRSERSTASESSIDEQICCHFIVFNKGSTVIFCYLFSSSLLISLIFSLICVLSFFLSFRDTALFH
jgi:hypothetical protein